jgi:hypothetical protein
VITACAFICRIAWLSQSREFLNANEINVQIPRINLGKLVKFAHIVPVRVFAAFVFQKRWFVSVLEKTTCRIEIPIAPVAELLYSQAMQPIKITRPQFPPGYADHPKAEVPWEYVAGQLREARHYWLCSVRPPSKAEALAGQTHGRPHCVPRWCVYVDGLIYYDGSPQTRHARNIMQNPHVSLHLESGSQAIILEGTSAPAGVPSAELAGRLVQAYRAKYAELGYSPTADQWDGGGLYVFTPRQCIAWTVFTENPTKFVFEGE